MNMDCTIKRMEPEDISILVDICRNAYSKNFHHHWEQGGLEPYMDKVFGTETLRAELDDPSIHYYVAFSKDEPIAFMKLNLHSNLPLLDPANGVELEKIYILPEFKGMGMGKHLLNLAFSLARDHGKEIFWLAVLDQNKEAIAFYKGLGFRFHSRTRVEFPGFKEELKGMWRMFMPLHPVFQPSL